VLSVRSVPADPERTADTVAHPSRVA